MKGIEFFFLLENNLLQYLQILVVIFIIYYIIFRKYFISIFDSFILLQLYSALAASVVVFLYIQGFIPNTLFWQFICSQVAYIIGLFTYKAPQLKNYIIVKTYSTKNIFYLISICSSIYIIFMLYTYAVFGIPLFMDSRLELYQNAKGLGIIGRICDVFQIISFTAIFYFLKFYYTTKRIRLYFYTIIVFLMLTLFLNGSKSALMIPFNIIFVLGFVAHSDFLTSLKKYNILIISSVILFSIFVISVQNEGDSILYLLERLVAFGDIYYQSYVNDIIYEVEGSYVDFIFGPFLKTFRLYSSNVASIGNQVFQIMTDNYEINAGPNPRLSVLALVCFGFVGSIIFSYFIGVLASYLRNVLSLKIRKNIFYLSVYVFIYIKILPLEVDVSLSVNNFTSLLISVTFFYVMIYILKKK